MKSREKPYVLIWRPNKEHSMIHYDKQAKIYLPSKYRQSFFPSKHVMTRKKKKLPNLATKLSIHYDKYQPKIYLPSKYRQIFFPSKHVVKRRKKYNSQN